MEWEDIFKLVIAVFTSVGGATLILFALSSWLGKVWASRILEKDKVKYQSELERIKKGYELDTEKIKSIFLRYTESQFHLYNNLWSSLCDLKFIADDLWEEASVQNAKKFAKQLKKTKEMVEKSILLIEDGHYESLVGILHEFGEYHLGKIRLIELRKRNVEEPDIYAIQEIINNTERKEEFTRILDRISSSFKNQIRGKAFL